jgi:DNA modification methylase
MNQLFYGDNLEVLRQSISDESVDLCYIDPPFFSQRNYYQFQSPPHSSLKIKTFEDTWRWTEATQENFCEILANEQHRFPQASIQLIAGFSQIFAKKNLLAYLVHLLLRVNEIHRILKPTGSFYFHCNPLASHYIKILLDTIFCTQGGACQNEIIWCYSLGGKSHKRYGRKHDVIFFYTKHSKEYTFNHHAASIPRKINSHMKKRVDLEGNFYQEKTDKKTGKIYRYYLEQGKISEDYWLDIETLNRNDHERLGYPTQKPEALLERIIRVSSQENDTILDAYCGSGTTVTVAHRLNRHWIGIDQTYQSIRLILHRLERNFGASILNQIQLKNFPLF